MPLPTASVLQRAFQCLASVALPQTPDVTSPAAKRGRLVHAVIASQLRGWEAPDIGRHQISVDMDQLRAYLGQGEMRCELAMQYDPVSRETLVIGENMERGYTTVPGNLYGTADIVVVRNRALVVDVKTGQRVADAKDNWQLRFLAVALAAAYQVDSVTGCLAYVARDGSCWFDSFEWSLFDLADYADEIAAKTEEWKSAIELHDLGWEPQATPSDDACHFCRCVCEHKVAA